MTYLDWNATTPPHPEVLEAMRDAAERGWANPSSVHGPGRRARELVENARTSVAELAGCEPRDVLFTSGGTESNNLALAGAGAIVTSRLEHPSITEPAEAHARAGGLVVWLPVPQSGRLSVEDVRGALRGLPEKAIVAVGAVNHETGVIQPIAEIAAAVRETGALFHVDAVQAAGRIDPSLWRHGDSLALSGHKIRAAKGIGALALQPGRALRPILRGGRQERGLRPGTIDAASACGFGVAARSALGGPERYLRLAALRDRLESALVGRALVNGGESPRAPHVSNLSFAGVRGDELTAALDLEGIAVSSGSACSAGTPEPSTVIAAMLGAERARGALRVSLGEASEERDIQALLDALERVGRRQVTRSQAAGEGGAPFRA